MEKVDVTIIGAGIVGLAVGVELSTLEREVYVVERHKSFGQETSSRNSEVIHAGIYYPNNSLKAKLCVNGNRMLYEICARHSIPHKKLGKLIVAVTRDEEKTLEELLKQGLSNGAYLKYLSRSEIKRVEPNVEAICAIYSPSTGIVDSHALMKNFESVIRQNIVYGCEVIAVEKKDDCYLVVINDSNEEYSFLSRIVVNCAGLNSDKIAAMVGIDVERAGYKLHYCKGDYFQVRPAKAKLTDMLIYPSPKKELTGLGVHTVKTLDNQMRVGPNSYYVDDITNLDVDVSRKPEFEAIRTFLPFIEANDLEPAIGCSGIRPKLSAPGEGFKDFVIEDEYKRGFPGFINLVGIESPGLTAAPAIACYVKELVKKYF